MQSQESSQDTGSSESWRCESRVSGAWPRRTATDSRLAKERPLAQLLIVSLLWGVFTAATTFAQSTEEAGDSAAASATAATDSNANNETPESEADDQPKPDALKQLLPLVSSDALVGVVTYPKSFFGSDVIRNLPAEVVALQLKEHYAIEFRHAEMAILFLVPDVQHGLTFGAILRFDSDFDWRTIDESLLQRTSFDRLHGKPYRRAKGPLDFSIYMVDERTLIFAPDGTLRAMMALRDDQPSAASIGTGLMQGVGKKLDIHFVANVTELRSHFANGTGDATLSDQSQLFSQLFAGAARFELRGRVTDRLAIGAIATAEEGTSAEQLDKDLKSWGAALAAIELPSPVVQPSATDESPYATHEYVQRTLGNVLPTCFTRVSGNRLQIGLRGNSSMHISANASVVMLLDRLLADLYVSIRRKQTSLALKRLSAAMNEYARHHNRFPTSANVSSDGEPLLSWRVHVLPFLGYESLYEEFHVDEPWDSPHNRKLIPRMPAIYQSPRSRSDYRTSFLVPVGDGTMFESMRHGVRIADIKEDAHSRTLMLVDADETVVWTQPRDLSLDKRDPWRGLGDSMRCGFLGATVDASVNFYMRSLDEVQLGTLFVRPEDESSRSY